jgi:ABC-type Mn2+/Zn2+ transport system ATPase subunit
VQIPLPPVTAESDGVRLDGVSVDRDGRRVLDAVTAQFATGTVTALIGPNGAGKSTLLHAIAGILEPVAGTVALPAGAAPDAGIAYVLQGTQVSEHLPVSVREVVTMGRYARAGLIGRLRADDRRAVDEAMERLDVVDLASRQVRDLSGGQRQRAFVAQGLAQEAPVLLLDEPITGLDVVSQRLILDAVTAERDAGRVVITSTHDLGEAAHADQVLLLAGRVVATGPPGDVLVAEHLATAYGHRLVTLGDNVIMLDDAPHHDHDHGDEVHPHPGHKH